MKRDLITAFLFITINTIKYTAIVVGGAFIFMVLFGNA